MSPSSITNSETHPEPYAEVDNWGDDEGLVPVAPTPHRPWQMLVVGFFVALIVGAGLVDSLWPLQAPPPVGDEGETLRVRQASARWSDGTSARLLETTSRNRSRVRHYVLPAYSWALRAGLRQVYEGLILGREDWLFLQARTVPDPLSDEQLVQRSVDILTDLHRRTEATGHHLLFVPLPRKATVALDYLPDRIDSRPHLDDLLIDTLHRSGINLYDIRPVLDTLPETRGELPYYPTDSHLTRSAMVEIAQGVAHHLDSWVPPDDRATQLVEIGPRPAPYDLLQLAKLHLNPVTRRLVPVDQRLDYEVFDAKGVRQCCDALNRPNTRSDVPPTARFAVVGTSFAALSGFAHYVAHFVDEPVDDYSGKGLHPTVTLDRLIETLAAAPADSTTQSTMFIVEIPIYKLFSGQYLE